MKNYLLVIIFTFSCVLNAQFVFNIGGNNYYEAKLYLENGSIKEGLLLDFNDKKVVNFKPQLIAEGFSSVETRLGLTNKFYYFRSNKDSKDEKIDFSDIKKIERKEYRPGSDEAHTVTYEKIKLIMYDNQLNKDMEVPEFFAPVQFTNGKINVFSFLESTCYGKSISSCKISGLHFYFKPVNGDFGIKPTNFTFGNFFTISKLTDKYFLSFKLLGENCPEFIKYVEQEEAVKKESFQPEFVRLVKDIYAKKLTDTYLDEYKSQLKSTKKKMSKDDFEKFEGQLYQKYLDDSGELFYKTLFEEMLIRYMNTCE